MADELETLRDQIRDVDDKIKDRITALEVWLTTLHIGVTVRLDDRYLFTRVRHTWRLFDVELDRPITDTRRDLRAVFLAEWNDKDKLIEAAEDSLRAVLAGRELILK